MVRKQQRPEKRALGSGKEDNYRSKKRGRKRTVLEDMNNGTDAEERKENGVSEIGDENGEKVKKREGEGEGGERGDHKEGLDLECEKEKDNGESERRLKFDDNCEVMREDTNRVSEEKNVFDEETRSLRKRLRGGGKKVNYNEYAVDEEIEEAIFGNSRKNRRGSQKGKKSAAEEVQENDASKEENEVVKTKKKRGRKSKEDEKARKIEGFEFEGAEAGDLEEDEGEGNKLRRGRPKKQEKKVEEESAAGLGCLEQDKDSSQKDDGSRYSLRTSRNQQEQHVSKDSKKKAVCSDPFFLLVLLSI